MARLIDAEALKKTFCAECDHTISCEDCDIDFHFSRLAPAVEAIPIEWLEREFSRRGIVTSQFRVMVGNEQLPDEVYVDARIVVRDIIDIWREEQKDETDKSRAFD